MRLTAGQMLAGPADSVGTLETGYFVGASIGIVAVVICAALTADVLSGATITPTLRRTRSAASSISLFAHRVFDRDILTFDIVGILETPAEDLQKFRIRVG